MYRRKMQIAKRMLMATVFFAVLILGTSSAVASAQAATPFSASFNFDTGTPSLSNGHNIPFNQTGGDVTAYFSSPAGSTFSIQTDSTTQSTLSQLTGKYLYHQGPYRDSLEIRFSQYLNSITFSFATIESHTATGDEPSNITVTAYVNSSTTTPIGSAKAHAQWPSGDTFPQGNITLSTGNTQFNLVRIEVPYESPRSAKDIIIDNIIVTGADFIIPEFPSWLILPIPMLAATLALFLGRKKTENSQTRHSFCHN